MTRYTNVGRKRTYVQAGFNNDGDADVIRESNLQTDALASFPLSNHATPVSTEPPKKKHRGGKARQSKRIGKDLNAATTSIGVESSGEVSVEAESTPGSQPLRKAVKSRDKKGAKSASLIVFVTNDSLTTAYYLGADARKFASEQRRLKRQDLRHLDTVCFACREKGHSAKACPKTSGFCEEKGGENRSKRRSSKPTVGICYRYGCCSSSLELANLIILLVRCGSRRHNLSKCPKPIDHENPLPFASCFVCSAIGHLAGSCPNNQEKGVYPNGGCCKLCGQTTHLAKDCDLRKQGGKMLDV